MKVLVAGGTGTVGSAVVRELLARKVDVDVLTRDAGKAGGLPPGARAVTGDLREPDTIRSAFKGADGFFLLNAVSQTEANEALMAVNGAVMGGVKKVVYLSVHHADRAPHLPHFGSKLGVEAALKASELDYTILRPNNFFQNDYWSKDALLGQGVYPQPLGDVGVSRVDVRDIAEAAAVAFTSGGHSGQTYNLAGPDALTGEATAQAWSHALGRPVLYGGNDLDVWERESLKYTPDWMVFDFKLMYAFFQKHGLKGTAEDLGRLGKLLGHAPRGFAAFAAETATAWKK